MYWQYLMAVVRRAFQPTARFTDVLQILAASAAPAVARFYGVEVPTSEHALAYIGAATVAFVALRLFFVAPYQVWREQFGELGTLKLEMSKPERLELARLAKVRAKTRIKMAEMLKEMHWDVFRVGDSKDDRKEAVSQKCVRLVTLSGRAGLPSFFEGGLLNFNSECQTAIESDEEVRAEGEDFTIVQALIDYLHGRITAEDCELQLPQGTGPETQP